MKKIGLILVLLMAFPVLAQAEVKMAYVEIQRVLETSDPGRTALDQLGKKFEEMRDELDKERADLEKMREEMQKQSLVLSQDAQQDMEVQLRRKVGQFQQMFQSYQARMQQEEQTLTEPIVDLLFDVINDYGEKNKYHLIFDAQGSGLIYADKAMNITDKIIEELNKAWKAKN